jgi:PAS domain S-box-containing protein
MTYPRALPYLARVLALAAVYFGAAKLGLSLAFVAEQVTVVWPPTGIALAALLLFGYRLWPGIALGAFLANATTPNETLTVAFGITVGNTLEALLGAWLLHRVVGFRNPLGRLKDVLGLLVLAAGVSTMVSATIGVASLCLGGVYPPALFGALWRTWWLGDAMGDLVMASVLLAWAAGPRLDWRPRRAAEAAAVLLGLGVVTAAVFIVGGAGPAPGYPLEYTTFPFVVWAALRFGLRGASTATVVALAGAIVGTVNDAGPFAGGTAQERLVQLDLYMAVIAVTALLLGATITERRMAERRRAVGYAVTEVLAESHSLRDAAARLLRVVCDNLGWDVGAVWSLDRQANVLRCVEVWRRPSLDVADFEQATRGRTFAPGAGLPGRVWSRGEAAWIPDVTRDGNFPRAAVAGRAGLHGAVAFPVVLGNGVLGVLEFFSRRIERPDEDLLRMLAAVGGQIGLFAERKRAEEALRQSETRLRAILDNTTAVIYVKDLHGRYQLINRQHETLFHRTRDAIQGKTDHEIFPKEIADAFRANDLSVLAAMKPLQWEEVAPHDDGPHTYVSVKFPLLDSAGAPYAVCGISTDITERKWAEEAAREADRRKDEFLAVLAHELRNPLAPIRNAVHVLKTPGADAPTADRARDLIERQVQHLVRLVDDLLDVSRIMRGKIELRKEPIDLAVVVARAVETAAPAVEAGGHNLTVSLPAAPLVLDVDPVRLAQVIANLLNNAAKYTEPGGRIVLAAGREGDEAVVRVSDTGVGVAADMLPRIFDLFVQADRSRERAQGGMGVGLTLVRSLVELHGGSVRAYSDGPGRGGEFVVRLPVTARAAAPEERGRPEEGASSDRRLPRRRILVVDDNVDVVESLALMLRLDGQDVRVARDGPAALEAARVEPPEVVLLDIGMPGMDGCEVARRLRQEPGLGDVLLVALTGWGQEEDRRRTAEAGFDHHLVKPVEPATLHTLLRRPLPASAKRMSHR